MPRQPVLSVIDEIVRGPESVGRMPLGMNLTARLDTRDDRIDLVRVNFVRRVARSPRTIARAVP